MFAPMTLAVAAASLFTAVSAYPQTLPNVALFNLPATVTPTAGQTLRLVYLGYGTQNYTCNATTSTFSTSGTAEAKLLDVSQFFTGNTLPAEIPGIQALTVVASHFYVPNPLAPGTTVPKFQQTCWNGDFFIGTKNATVANAVPTYSVATALLKNIEPGKVGGSLADWVVRTDVVGGVVPAALNTCKAGDAIAIPYKAHYLFFKQ